MRARAAALLLTELESKQLLSLYGIPTVETRVAASEDEAVTHRCGTGLSGCAESLFRNHHPQDRCRRSQTELAGRSGGPLRLSRHQVFGCGESWCRPILRRHGAADGEARWLRIDPWQQRGPAVWARHSVRFRWPTGRSVSRPRPGASAAEHDPGAKNDGADEVFTALKGVRGRKPVNMAALEQLLVRFSQLVLEQRWIAEIDINPLLASPERMLALDARIVLQDPPLPSTSCRKPAIRPYPLQYVSTWTMKDGNPVTIRPIRPEDEPLMVKFHETLSDRSVYLRYFCSLSLSRRVAHERLLRICFGDYDREMALVAERTDPATGERRIMAVGRMNKLHGKNEAEVAVLVSDQYQKLGLGTNYSAVSSRLPAMKS